MILRYILSLVLICLAVATPSANAQSLGNSTVTTVGHGPSEKDAVHDALAQAVAQVRGLSISSHEYVSIQDTIKDDQSSNLTQYKSSVNTHTKGLVSSFSINQSERLGNGSYKVSVTAVVPFYKAGAQLKRLRMAVLPLKIGPATGGSAAATNAGHEWSARLEDSLVQTRRFAMLDRSYMEQSRNELAQYLSGEFNPAEAARIGQRAGTDYIVTGEVVKYQVIDKSVQNPLNGDRIPRSQLNALVSLRLIDVATGQVKFAKTYALGESAAVDIVNAIYPLMVVALSEEGVTVGQGGDSIRVGQQYQVLALGRELRDPYTGESLGQQEMPVGKVQIVSTQFKTSEARILSGAEKIRSSYGNGLVLRPLAGGGEAATAPRRARKAPSAMEEKW